jgi:hypothetical protein
MDTFTRRLREHAGAVKRSPPTVVNSAPDIERAADILDAVRGLLEEAELYVRAVVNVVGPAQVGERALDLADRIDAALCGELPRHADPFCPDDMRALGWDVVTHYDFRVDGERHTRWVLAKAGRCIAGDGLTDVEALNVVRFQLYSSHQ